jgi:hypothetical protein
MKFAACLALLCGSVPAFGGYAGFRLFTINHTLTGTVDSTNFTVLLSGTYAEFATTANGGKVQSTVSCGVNSINCPADLVFTSDSACSSPLAGWEFESYSASTGQIVAWVLVPTLSVTANTLIYACVGNPAITSFQGGSAGSAFDSNTKLVYHFPNGTTLSAKDSSSGGCNATPANSPTAVTGEIGGGINFNGSNQDVECSSFSWTGTSPVTVSFWNYVTSAEEQNSFAFTVGNSAATDPHRFSASVPWGNGQLFWDYGINANGTGRVAATYTPYLGAWTYVTLVSTGSANTYQAIYLNGTVNVSASSSASSTVTGDLIVGAYPWASQYGPPYQNGNMDEFRISNVVRSPSWILAEYNNQSSPSTFYTASPFAALGGPIQQVVCDYSSNSPCTLNSSTVTIPITATGPGSALIMTYGGGATSSQTISSVSCTGCTWVQAISCSQTRVVEIYYALNVPSGTTTVTVTLNSISDWWFNVSEWSWLPLSGTVIDNSQTGCSSGTSSATQTSASVTTTNRNDLIIFADRATQNYLSGPTNGFVGMSQSASEQMLSAYYLPGAAGTYSSSFTTSSAAVYVTAIVAFLPHPFQRSHIAFGR